MNDKQKKILSFISPNGLGSITLSQLGKYIGITNRQTVKYHLDNLEKMGHVLVNRKNGNIISITPTSNNTNEFLNIPIYGSANCGPATILAEENLDGYLKISPKILNCKFSNFLFALKASGDSMNLAKKIAGGPIEDEDFVIVDSSKTVPEDGEYVVSVINGAANIKKFKLDEDNKRVVLLSESVREYQPIFIHEDDDFMINGKVIQVIKGVR